MKNPITMTGRRISKTLGLVTQSPNDDKATKLVVSSSSNTTKKATTTISNTEQMRKNGAMMMAVEKSLMISEDYGYENFIPNLSPVDIAQYGYEEAAPDSAEPPQDSIDDVSKYGYGDATPDISTPTSYNDDVDTYHATSTMLRSERTRSYRRRSIQIGVEGQFVYLDNDSSNKKVMPNKPTVVRKNETKQSIQRRCRTDAPTIPQRTSSLNEDDEFDEDDVGDDDNNVESHPGRRTSLKKNRIPQRAASIQKIPQRQASLMAVEIYDDDIESHPGRRTSLKTKTGGMMPRRASIQTTTLLPHRTSLKKKGMPRRASIQTTGEEIETYLPGQSQPVRRRTSITFAQREEVKEVTPSRELTNEPETLWFQKEELRQIRQKNRRIVDHVTEAGGHEQTKRKLCLRGLEDMLGESDHSRQQDCVSSVLQLQDLQRKTGYYDCEYMSRLYQHASKDSLMEATRRAMEDALVIDQYDMPRNVRYPSCRWSPTKRRTSSF